MAQCSVSTHTAVHPLQGCVSSRRPAPGRNTSPSTTTRAACTEPGSSAVSLRVDRRKALVGALGLLAAGPAVLLAPAAPAAAEPEAGELERFTDGADRYSLNVPQSWGRHEGTATNSRKATVWYPESSDSRLNITVLISNIGADFTSLGSFGKADEFGASLVASMDRSFLLRSPFRKKDERVQQARLLDARERGQKYFIEYTVQRPEEDEPRHIYSVVALAFDGRYNRLYTVTGQCLETDVPKYGRLLEKSLQTFQPPANTSLL